MPLLRACEVNTMDYPSRYLAFHGAIVLLVGLLCGALYGLAIRRGASDNVVQRWRVAHASLPIGAILMFAVAGILPLLSASRACQWLVAFALIPRIASHNFVTGCLTSSVTRGSSILWVLRVFFKP